ncbi:Signal transduction histidine kinase [Paraburkholderia sartisoli]|uniref:Virulence sensor protein BvgS n=2 Tax=Paraburkholderia sartisoli TaxID=83784 RepID=A0A1H4HP70_9BURK|nr:ATP-binding protein [Paraburkholderia sartisoli]SEB23627.1 Signal transduction histidine kinase [Paraburkholderia sartisoli]
MKTPPPHEMAMPGRSWRRFLLVLIWLAALAPPVAAVGYFLCVNLLNPQITLQTSGTYDGFYWDAAQLQIAYSRFQTQLLLYQTGEDPDYAALQLSYQVLQSKLHVMDGSTRMLASRPTLAGHQKNEIQKITALLALLDPDIEALEHDPGRADGIVGTLRAHWEEVNGLALSRRDADVYDREAMNHDFLAKRRLLFATGMMLLLLSAAATVLLVLNGYRRTRLIRQQRAALAAEHQASRAARESGLAKDAFLGMISHELRTPLHAIVSSIELLGLNVHSEADRNVIRRLETAARQLEAQMKDLTDYARLGAGRLELRHERFDPRELISSIADQHAPAAGAKGLAFESDAVGDTGLVESDPHRIRQIVNNLVTNAIRYTETGGVRLQLVQGPTLLSIFVRDTGPGVHEDQIPLIFREFTQLDASRARRFEGAGMGLSIVKGLVDLFGGSIQVESRVGEGTTFRVTIPVVSVAPAAAADTEASIPAGGAPARVLIVDDNPLVRESLSEMIMHLQCEAASCATVDAALVWLDTHRCDVILLDLSMPGKDGYAFVEAFAARDVPTGHAPVIAVSADAPAADARAPFFDCLSKPVHFEELRVVVQRALAARHTA